eukprot:m.247752 g.247752  ORF g.247752 m.247752 type:complete len:142 (+) comp15486_c0_seq1:18-443(+)
MVRFKNRYFLVEIVHEDGMVDESLSAQQLLKLIREAVGLAHGDFGLGCLQGSLSIKYMNVYTGAVLIRCARDHHALLWSALTLITSIKKRSCIFNLLHLGGTIRSCQRFLLAHNKAQLRLLAASAPDEATRIRIEAMAVGE